MNKFLNHPKLDALVEAAGRRKTHFPEEVGRDQAAVACNFRRLGALTQEQVQAIRSLHDTFARSLTNSLGAYIRGAFEVALESVEQVAYPEFVQRISEPNFVCSIALHPWEAVATVEFDLALALPLIDMLLGGTGSPITDIREVTDIEEEILSSLVQLACRELQAAWLPVLKLDIRSVCRQRQDQMRRLMTPRERVLVLSFAIRAAEVQGKLRLAFPAVVTNALLKNLEERDLPRLPSRRFSDNLHLRKVLEQCSFHAELVLPEAAIPAKKLMHLKVGEVLKFQCKATVPVLFKVENQTLFLAHPVAMGDQRAAEMSARALAHQPVKEESH
jgi:flagellar motor switch protein FliM